MRTCPTCGKTCNTFSSIEWDDHCKKCADPSYVTATELQMRAFNRHSERPNIIETHRCQTHGFRYEPASCDTCLSISTDLEYRPSSTDFQECQRCESKTRVLHGDETTKEFPEGVCAWCLRDVSVVLIAAWLISKDAYDTAWSGGNATLSEAVKEGRYKT
jgi:hypothetical protein